MNNQNVEIFLFRHGETDWNVQERFQGHLDVPLNHQGRTQAKQLVPILQNKSIQAILSSDLSRTFETAQIIADSLKVKVFSSFYLREAHLGEAQGLTRKEIENKYGKDFVERWRSSRTRDGGISYPGGETGDEVIKRSFDAIKSFLDPNPFSKVGISTHGGVIRRLLHHLLPQDAPSVPVPNVGLYQISYNREPSQFNIEPNFLISSIEID